MTRIHKIREVLLIGILFISPLTSVHADGGDWLVRLRGVAVVPLDKSDPINLITAGVVLPLDGSGVSVDRGYTPELDVTYMFTRYLGLEVIAGATRHTVSLEGPGPILALNGLTDGFELFNTWAVPPTVTLQLHFSPDGKIRPYIGAGGNYTLFLNEDATGDLVTALGPVKVKLKNSYGWVAQAGFDFDLKEAWYVHRDWYVNFDVKYIDMSTTATLDLTSGQRLQVDVDVNPLVFGIGVGLRF